MRKWSRRFVEGRQCGTHLTMFCRSAPENPGVPRARIIGSTSAEPSHKSTKSKSEMTASGNERMGDAMHVRHRPGAAVTPDMWCFRIWVRPLTSGSGTATCLSKRPGRTSALVCQEHHQPGSRTEREGWTYGLTDPKNQGSSSPQSQ